MASVYLVIKLGYINSFKINYISVIEIMQFTKITISTLSSKILFFFQNGLEPTSKTGNSFYIY